MSRTGLLVASPAMQDPFFSRTVVLLCDYGEDGAIGVITNRITDVTSEEVLEQMDIVEGPGIRKVVHWGGPVQPGAVFLTFDGDAPEVAVRDVKDPEADEEMEPTFCVTGRLRVSPSRDVIESVAHRADSDDAFLTLGYAGWAPGQLDEEIRSGSWILFEADDDLVFRVAPEDQWDHCIASLGIKTGELWMMPIEE